MVMSVDIPEKEETVENIRDDAPEDNEKARVSDTEKELAAEASSAYNSGDFNGCLASLEKLEGPINSLYVLWTFQKSEKKIQTKF